MLNSTVLFGERPRAGSLRRALAILSDVRPSTCPANPRPCSKWIFHSGRFVLLDSEGECLPFFRKLDSFFELLPYEDGWFTEGFLQFRGQSVSNSRSFPLNHW